MLNPKKEDPKLEIAVPLSKKMKNMIFSVNRIN